MVSRCGALILAVSVATLAAQQVRDVRRETTGTASIAGTVESTAPDLKPLRRVLITVSGGSLVGRRVTVTDDNGRFVIGGLTAGQYTLSASKPGYVTMNYGATRPGRQGTSVVVVDGQRATIPPITMPRGAVIAGTVTTGAGEPEPEVQVTAIRWQLRQGVSTLVPVAQSTTDDRGEYRIAGLDRGNYLVSVEPANASRGPADLIQLPENAVDRVLQQIREPATAGSSASASPSNARPIGPAPVYYPGTVRPAAAATVTLSRGEERTGLDIKMELVPMARLTGGVTSADGRGAPGVLVTLTSLGPPAPNFAYALGARLGPKRTDAQGQFAFVGVPPGDYSLLATTRQAAPRGAAPPDPDPRMAFSTVSINGDDVAMSLPLQPAMSMTGRFAFEGSAPPPNLTSARLTLEGLAITQLGMLDIFTANAEPDGTFRATDLSPGHFAVTVTPPSSSIAPGWALKSIVSGGRDLLDAPFVLAPGDILSDVVVTFTDRPAELTGALQNSSGIPTSDYFIVVFTTNRTLWFPNSRRIVSVRPNSGGVYSVRGLPPGDYFIAAVTDVEQGEWFDPDFLASLGAGSPIRISISEGETKKQDLRIVK